MAETWYVYYKVSSYLKTFWTLTFESAKLKYDILKQNLLSVEIEVN
jgi:hypothetical protein